MIDDDEVEDYRRGPGPGYRPPAPKPRGRLDWTDHPDRKLSLTVRCRDCTAPVGVVCRNLAGRFGAKLDFAEAPDLRKLPAHPSRINDAKRGPKQL